MTGVGQCFRDPIGQTQAFKAQKARNQPPSATDQSQKPFRLTEQRQEIATVGAAEGHGETCGEKVMELVVDEIITDGSDSRSRECEQRAFKQGANKCR